MPQLQNLVLTDRAGTPVNHTLTPLEIAKDGLATVAESSGVPIGNITAKIVLNKTSTGKYKAILKFVFPVVQTQTINGVSTPVVVRTAYVNADFTFDPTSTTQERKDAVGMFQSAFAPAQLLVNDTLVNLQGIY